MDKPLDNFSFKMMSAWFSLRDRLHSPKNILQEADIKPGFKILDYGCGPGGFSIAAAELVGGNGKVYAADILPIALMNVQKRASRHALANIETIHTDRATGLEDGSVDLVLLYDILHGLADPDSVLAELHRVLKPDSTLSFSDHHMAENEILTRITGQGLFRFLKKGDKTYTFKTI